MHSDENVIQADVSEEEGDDGGGCGRIWGGGGEGGGGGSVGGGGGHEDDGGGELVASHEIHNTTRIYLHKKFKKMETVSKDDVGNVETSLSLVGKEKSTNVSLEALFQVTGHELEKIKNSCEVGSKRVSQKASADDAFGVGMYEMVREGGGGEWAEDGGHDDKRIRASGGRHSCPFCGLSCGKPSVLQKHIRAHTNERPYPCIPCGFAFKTKSNLYKHCKSRAHHLRASRELVEGEVAATTELVLRWPENGSDSFVRQQETDESSDSNDGGLLQSIDTRDVSEASATSRSTDDLSKLEKAPSVGCSSIYKPKFHLVTQNSSVDLLAPEEDSPNDFRLRQVLDFERSRETIPGMDVDFSTEGDLRVESSSMPVERIEGDGRNHLSTSLVGRHKRHFHLRLEIPPSVSCEVPPVSNVSSASVTSASSSSLIKQSLATTTTQSESRSVSNCVAQDAKCHKLASPEYLQEHISKLISQNAAIVDRLDPRWPRRYTRQSSIASSQNVDGELRSKERLRRMSEDVTLSKVAPHLAKSKLARALLATTATASTALCATLSDAVLCSEKIPTCSNIVEELTNFGTNEMDANVSNDLAASSLWHKEKLLTDEGPKDGSIIKSLLTLNKRTLVKTSRDEENSLLVAAVAAVDGLGHPQNPEGSIIKDLLLKARTGDGGLVSMPHSTSDAPSASLRLSGGSISVVQTVASSVESLPVTDESNIALYNCSICNVGFRSPENLEVHQTHYCKHVQETPQTLHLVEHNLYGCDVGVDQSRTPPFSRDGSEPSSCTSSHKPRGRPKGSKNRPKVESGGMVASGKQCRANSKSVLESLEDVSETMSSNLTSTRGIVLSESSNSIREILACRSPCLPSVLTEVADGGCGGGGDSTDASVPENSPGRLSRAEVVDILTDGPILKKHLMSGFLSGDRSPPLKKRKIPVDVIATEGGTTGRCDTSSSGMMRASYTSFLMSLEHLSKNPMRASSSGNLFGGEVHVCDSVSETERLLVDGNALQQLKHSEEDEESDCARQRENVSSLSSVASTAASVVTTIAKPVHNSGGTVLQMHGASFPVSTCIHVATVGRPLMATGSQSGRGTFKDLSGAIVLSPSAVKVSSSFAIDISHLNLTAPASLSKASSPPGDSSFVSSLTSFGKNQIMMPEDRDGCLNILSDGVRRKMERISRSEVPTIAVISPKSPSDKENGGVTSSLKTTHLTPSRPTSLPLRGIHSSMVGTTLVSPETPRPKKKYGQCFINGQYYTYLELKQSTKVYYCCIHRPQPMYVPQATDPKLSMYSVWQTVNAKDDPLGITPAQALGFYDSRHRGSSYTQAVPVEMPLQTTHSSYWTFRQKAKCNDTEEVAVLDSNNGTDNSAVDEEVEVEEDEEEKGDTNNDETMECLAGMEDKEDGEAMWVDGDLISSEDSCTKRMRRNEDRCEHANNTSSMKSREPKRVRIFAGGFKSNEDYTYVRGRGRGKYVCEECGIRCKKPSMLKKHIRTHTDVRPYTCKHCNFSFKTKGNLTKHMKSKAHHKKCVEMGVVPVPVAIDDVQIDEEALARQERIEHQRRQFANDEDSSLEEEDDEEDDEDEEDEEEEDGGNEGYREGEDEDDESVEMEGQFDDAFSTDFKTVGYETPSHQVASDQVVVARSLLDLSRPSFFGRNADHVGVSQSVVVDGCKEVTGNRPVSSWLTEHESIDSRSTCVSSRRVQSIPFEGVTKGDTLKDAESSNFSTYPFDRSLGGGRLYITAADWSEPLSSPQQENQMLLNAARPSSASPSLEATDGANCDQPIDLSMPHTRSCDLEPGRNRDSSLPRTIEESCRIDLQCYENVSPLTLPKVDCNSYALNQSTHELLANAVSTVRAPSPDEHNHHPNTLQRSLVLQSNRTNVVTSVDCNGNVSLSSAVYVSKETTQRSSPTHLQAPPPPSPFVTVAAASPSTSTHNPLDGGSVKTLVDCPRPLTPIGFQKMPTYMQRPNEDGKCVCSICNKTFSRPSQLRLHVNIHYFERPFRCDSCAISFRTKGHLQKHKRSVSHYNKVNMNLTFGTPTTDNPRPFKCADCKIAFRIHGHLAKHLRSKMHIMKLECLGKLPFGTYAEIERSGANLNEIDTTDCENSLESLQTMALKLVDKVPTRQHWSRERTISGGSCDDQSDGVPYVESPGCGPESAHFAVGLSGGGGGEGGGDNVSPEFTAADRLVVWSRSVLESSVGGSHDFATSVPPGVKYEGDAEEKQMHVVSRTSAKLLVVVECERRESEFRRLLEDGPYRAGSLVQNYEDISEDDDLEGSVVGCGNLQSPPRVETTRGTNETSSASLASKGNVSAAETIAGQVWGSSDDPVTDRSSPIDKCELCGESFSTAHALNQHMLAHAQLRPYVCDYCDAGFTTVQHLQAHVQLHQKQGKAFLCRHCRQSFDHGEELESHLEAVHCNHDEDQVR